MIQYPRSPRIVMEGHWVYFAWLVPVAVLGLCYRFRAQGPWMLCAAWFVAALVPVLGLAPFGYQDFSTVADRYVYLALFAPALAFAWWIGQHPSKPTLTVGCLVLAAFAVLSFRQAAFWRDSQSLFTQTLRLNPRSHVAHGGLAADRMLQGRFAEALEHLDESFRISHRAAERDYLNRARALLGLNRVDEAIAAYQQTLIAYPRSTAAHWNIAAAYFQKQDWDSAIQHSRVAVAAEPGNQIARFNLALSLEKAGQVSAAAEQFAELVAQRPSHYPARLKLGMQLASQGRRQEAIGHFQYILAQRDDPSAHAELAAALIKEGDLDAALRHYQQALAQDSPYWADIANRLAWLLATHPSPRVRDARQAIALAEQACLLTNNQQPEMIQTLAAAQAEAGDFDQAIALTQRAGELAKQQGQSQRAAAIQEQLAAFRQRRPYRESMDK
jgi:tetratricopeptide (TPR) repeat protein